MAPRAVGSSAVEPERHEDVVDATRRTRLASERTYLAWWRSALAAVAVVLGVGKVVPELTGGTSIGYELVGVGYGLLGIAFVIYGHRRQQELDRALTEGRFIPLGRGVMLVFTISGIILGAATVAAVLA